MISYDTRYEVINQVGSGYHGEVYKAKERSSGKIVAIKEGAHTKEANALKTLKHPGIPKFYDYFEIGDRWCKKGVLVMEYVDAVPLREYKFKSTQDAIRVGIQLCLVVRYLHGKGFVHGDLHRGNILVTSGQVYLVDFGLALRAHKDDCRYAYEREDIAEYITIGTRDASINKLYSDVSGGRLKTIAGIQRRLLKLVA